jgi:hypothetical protein
MSANWLFSLFMQTRFKKNNNSAFVVVFVVDGGGGGGSGGGGGGVGVVVWVGVGWRWGWGCELIINFVPNLATVPVSSRHFYRLLKRMQY